MWLRAMLRPHGLIMQGWRLCVGWTGDSRAVLGRREPSGKCRAISLTHDHKPVNPPEAIRIKAAGGRIERHVSRALHSLLG